MPVIGVAGTAKNTGKTTTLVTLLKALLLKKLEENIPSIGLTGIGYDGESFDNVTGLPKPRIDVHEGMIVAVAEKCIKSGKAKIKPLIETAIKTPLGRIVIGQVTEAGKLVLAGPAKRSDLAKTLDYMRGSGAGLIFVDGAFGRIAPFAEADGLVLATGASRNTDISDLARENGNMISLLNRPVMNIRGAAIETGSVLSEESFDAFMHSFIQADTMLISGLLSGRFLDAIAENKTLQGKRLLFDNPLKLLLAGEINQTYAAICKMEQDLNIEVGTLKPVKVIALTVNPYYPKYNYARRDYEAAYVDKTMLRSAIEGSMGIPCYDVVADGAEGLEHAIFSFSERMNYKE